MPDRSFTSNRTTQAADDLQAIYNFIGRDSEQSGHHESILAAIDNLIFCLSASVVQESKWILRSVSSLSTAQPERGRQSTAKRAQRAEFIERSETVDGCRSGGYL
jgi:hypothetical protein